MVDETTDENINETGSSTGQHTPAPRYVEKNGERLEIPDNFWDKENDKPNEDYFYITFILCIPG